MIGFYKAVMILRSNKICKHYADLKKIKKLYKSSFPKNERMRFGALLKSADSPMVDWAAYYDGEKLVGFTYLAFDEEIAYLFYFAVDEALRSKGYGGEILTHLKQKYSDKTIVLDMEASGDVAANREQRIRRKAFYVRSGFIGARFDSVYRGVHYESMVFGGECGKQRLMQLFKKYRREALGKRK